MAEDYGRRARDRLGSRTAHEAAVRALLERQAGAAETMARWTQQPGRGRQGVLETGSATLSAAGVWGVDVRSPFASVALLNRSAGALTAVAGGRGEAPGDGPGQFTVMGWGFALMPLVGQSLAVHGAAGARFSYSLLSEALGPVAAAGAVGGAGAAALANVAASAVSVTIRAANPSRRGLWVVNDSASATLYLAMDGTAASVTNYSAKLLPGERYEMPQPVVGTAVTGIWSAAVGAARVTELT